MIFLTGRSRPKIMKCCLLSMKLLPSRQPAQQMSMACRLPHAQRASATRVVRCVWCPWVRATVLPSYLASTLSTTRVSPSGSLKGAAHVPSVVVALSVANSNASTQAVDFVHSRMQIYAWGTSLCMITQTSLFREVGHCLGRPAQDAHIFDFDCIWKIL